MEAPQTQIFKIGDSLVLPACIEAWCPDCQSKLETLQGLVMRLLKAQSEEEVQHGEIYLGFFSLYLYSSSF